MQCALDCSRGLQGKNSLDEILCHESRHVIQDKLAISWRSIGEELHRNSLVLGFPVKRRSKSWESISQSCRQPECEVSRDGIVGVYIPSHAKRTLIGRWGKDRGMHGQTWYETHERRAWWMPMLLTHAVKVQFVVLFSSLQSVQKLRLMHVEKRSVIFSLVMKISGQGCISRMHR